MATLFDESGVIVAYSNSQLAKLLCDFKWKELFWLCREEVNAQMGFYLFGHGLYEKAMQPYVGMTGQGLLMPVEMEFLLGQCRRECNIWMSEWLSTLVMRRIAAIHAN